MSPYYTYTRERREADDHAFQPAAYDEAPTSMLAKAASSASMDPGPLLEQPAERKLPAVADAVAVAWKLPADVLAGKLPAAAVAGKLPAAAVAGKLPADALAGKLPAFAVAGKLPTAAAVAGRKRRRSAVDRRRKRKLRKAAQLAAISWPAKWEVRTSLSIYDALRYATLCSEVKALLS